MSGRQARIVVWLDPTAPQEASMQALAGLGAAAEILGLFVEDTDLLGLAHLSVAREITYEGAAIREFDQDRVEQQFRVHGARLRRLFESAARRISPQHSFRVARGKTQAEVLKASVDCDMLVLAHSRRQFGTRLTIRARLDELLSEGPVNLVFVQEHWRTGRRIAVLYDGSPASEAALGAAVAVARTEHLSVSIWIPNGENGELRATVRAHLTHPVDYDFRDVDAGDVAALVNAAEADDVRMLVLPAGKTEDIGERVAALLDRANCSIMVTR